MLETFLIFDATPVFNLQSYLKDQVLMILKQRLQVTNPTADRTITIPDETGTLVTTGSTGVVTSAMIA